MDKPTMTDSAISYLDELASKHGPMLAGIAAASLTGPLGEQVRAYARMKADEEREYVTRMVRAKELVRYCYPGVDWEVFMDDRAYKQAIAGTWKP